MKLSDFRRAGHWPTLLFAFLYFDVSFMIWVLLGPLANAIAPELRLSDAQKGFLVAVPLLGGSLFRPILGTLTDYLGARRTSILGMFATLIPLFLGWLWADSFNKLLIVGLLLGVSGASFAAALPLASRWYPPRYQGLVMGIAGAGNSGTALATLFGPALAKHLGWHAVFGLALIPILLVLVFFSIFAKDAPDRPAPKTLADYVGIFRQADTWWFCLFYSVTFGGFVGLASYLNIFFKSQYGLSPQGAGWFATFCVIAGSFVRPLGGFLSDRFGGIRMLTLLYVGTAISAASVAFLPPLPIAATLLFATMALLGMGNGAVFQLVPLRFSKEIGVLTGVVGAAGGLGGFFLPSVLGVVKQWTDSFTGGFLFFGLAALGAAFALSSVARGWEGTFVSRGGRIATQSPADFDEALPSSLPSAEAEPAL